MHEDFVSSFQQEALTSETQEGTWHFHCGHTQSSADDFLHMF